MGVIKWMCIEDEELGEERVGRRGNGDNESREVCCVFILRIVINILIYWVGNVLNVLILLLKIIVEFVNMCWLVEKWFRSG